MTLDIHNLSPALIKRLIGSGWKRSVKDPTEVLYWTNEEMARC
jgi:hypothetical protein